MKVVKLWREVSSLSQTRLLALSIVMNNLSSLTQIGLLAVSPVKKDHSSITWIIKLYTNSLPRKKKESSVVQ